MNDGRKVDPAAKPRKAALILAGAAAKGPFAAGALSVVADRLHSEFRITRVVGTSSGALNAAVFAAGLRVGKPKEAAQKLEELWKDDATVRNIVTFQQRKHIVKKALAEIRGWGDEKQHDLKLRIAITTLDGNEVSSGHRHYTTYESTKVYHPTDFTTDAGIDDIAGHAIASAAIPFVFSPVRLDGTAYVDGGVVDNAPIAWALHEDQEIEDLIVVTSDPRVAARPAHITPFPLVSVIDVVVRERLTRDLLEAYSFNAELEKLAALGVDMERVRRQLKWRRLKIVEVRPPHETAGNFLSGFFFKSQRVDNWEAGRTAALGAFAEPSPRPAPPPAPTPTPPPPPQSLHLRKSSELLLIAPIKEGLVAQVPVTITYAARLEQLLKAFFALRQAGVERLAGNETLIGPLETVTSLHFVQWAILDNGTRLLLAVTFEGPWESYIRGIVDNAGPFLDVIFCHCEGYFGGADRNSTADGFEPFAQWVRQHQVPVDFFHSAAPDMSANDVVWLRALAKLRAQAPGSRFAADATALTVPTPSVPEDPTKFADITTFVEALSVFFALGLLFATPDDVFLHRAAARQLRLLRPLEPVPDDLESLPGASQDAWKWYEQYLLPIQKAEREKEENPLPPEVATLQDRDTVQGNILTGYQDMVDGRLVFFRFDSREGAAGFLEAFKPTIERSAEPRTQNIALTFGGFQSLGLGDLVDLPEEFREGMERRSPMLGDVGVNHPYFWQRPLTDGASPGPRAQRVDLTTIDAVVMYQSRVANDSQLDAWVDRLRGLRGQGVCVLGVQYLCRPAGPIKEPFGYTDEISQPVPLEVDYQHVGLERDKVALGELLLGYKNAKGESRTYVSPDVFRNGSFLAMRKFKQDVDGFDAFVDGVAKSKGPDGSPLVRGARDPEEELRGKIMGRYRDGDPLALGWYGSKEKQNDFDYQADPRGEGCPLSAHVRRANPRIKGTPRILRRGFSYRDADDDRGLVFMAYCASLGSQYEVVQKWVNGGNSTRTYGGQVDPTLAVNGLADSTYSFLSPGGGAAVAVPTPGKPDKPLVSLQWGLYLFAPSSVGLEAIASLAKKRAAAKTTARKQSPGAVMRCPFAGVAATPIPPAALAAAEAELSKIEALDRRDALDAWRELVEEENEDVNRKAAAIFAVLRTRAGFYPSAYGLLATREKDNQAILANHPEFSVREYGERMKRSFGLLYLGQDAESGHDEAAAQPNAFIAAITREAGYEAALAVGREALKRGLPIEQKPVPEGRVLVDLGQWADFVLCRLVAEWFGFPEEGMRQGGTAMMSGTLPCCPEDFRIVSEYVFGPQPTDAVAQFAQMRGALVAEAAATFTKTRKAALSLGGASAKGPTPRLIDELLRTGYMKGNEDAIARAWIGAVNGFTVPTSENFQVSMLAWLGPQGPFWRLQQAYRALDKADRSFLDERQGGFLACALVSTMQGAPIPYVLHRRVKADTDLSPGVKATPSTPVVLSLMSAGNELLEAQSPDSSVLFGGAYKAQKGPGDPLHACPGKEMALGVLMGLAAAVFERNNLVSEGMLAVSFDREPTDAPADGFQA
jgi:predicted acylesterase/phospholipase RssA